MLRTIFFVTGFGMTLAAFASFHRIEDPFSGNGPERAFISLFWFIAGTTIASWAARPLLTAIRRLTDSWFDIKNGNDFVTLWIKCKQAELQARTAEYLEKAKGNGE
ncbi:hypothetical protein [Paracoccus aestuariivivens]|uniref:Uncharacterized protein n=1 Tax=Paracoccus aestuariivivens TaxID=1820333 RepID=A0A6L6J8S6_9RHOB|nr:hypothetical protein [Paracoccus aestuariivivens]MTH77568.1 hypothetical protein [Paracoccus aestuariivivens]